MTGSISKFIRDQLSVWPLAAANFRSLRKAGVRVLEVGGLEVRLQHNPCRIASSTAQTDKDTLDSRPCFLCEEHRPKEQYHLRFEGRKGRLYNIQVNPYPIFPGHLVIARTEHLPQAIWHHLPDMLDFARMYRDYLVYYNGPRSGASAPDHLHFQAIPRHSLPLEEAVDRFLNMPGTPLSSVKDATLYHFRGYTRGVYAMKSTTTKSLAKIFYQMLDCVPLMDGDTEPRFNLYCWFSAGEYRMMAVLRTELRSHHYESQGPDHLTISPGCAEMGGVFVAPVAEDFEKVTPADLEEMLSEVSVSREEEEKIDWRLTRKERKIEIGIMRGEEIRFEVISDGAGIQKVSLRDGRIDYGGVLYDELYFDSMTRSTLFAEPSFILYGVTIGVDFHWQQKRDLSYAGALKFIVEDGQIVAVNRIGIENYLLSVISSEMKSSAPLELLKAHAVISRSWLYANLGRHGIYDVCADDHCQRYQGRSMAEGDSVKQAIEETWGKVLKYEGVLCDARYSKCCGGRTELFSTCWEDKDFPYLQSVPDKYCNCSDVAVLSSVLNDYDLVTRDFFEWEQRYSEAGLSDLVARKSGRDIGTVLSLEPLETGPSGRISSLLIKGTDGEITVGKELEIRRMLSDSHLKSSAFTVSRDGSDFVLKGRGWGHGVGLCQIGAAVMASEGFTFDEILSHYYPGAEICEENER